MNTDIHIISLGALAITFIPVAAVIYVLHLWSRNAKDAAYGIGRMLLQLLLVGYALTYIFDADNQFIILGVLTVMLIAAGWIALRTVPHLPKRILFPKTFISILICGGAVLAMVIIFVLHLDPWYLPRYVIPLAGMIFAGSMNSISIAAERLYSECARGVRYDIARSTAFTAGLIPIINSLFAVGLVSLPGMMTGQILSGVSPLIAARYQIMVMAMLFSAAGLSTALFFYLTAPYFKDIKSGKI